MVIQIKNRHSIVRKIVLIIFLVLFTIFSLRHFILGGGVAASVDALCPFGGFETLYTLIATGGFVPRILMSSLVLAIGILLTTILFRKGFCGYICPFGTVQELLGKIKKKKYNPKFHHDLTFVKYFILIAILIITAYTGVLVFRSYDPFATFFHFGKGLFWEVETDALITNVIAFVITAGVLIGAVFIDRFFCRYLCPLGATMNLFAFFGFTKIKRDHTCINCKLCDKACPMNIEVSKVNYIKDVECINCNLCVNVCPKDSLSISTLGKKISPIIYVISLIVLFFGVVATAKAIGIWNSIPTLSTTSGEFDPEMIKGWMTLQQVSEESAIHLPHFYIDLGIPDTVLPTTPLKDIKNYVPDFETDIVREYIKNFKHSSDHQIIEQVAEESCPWGLINDPIRRCGFWKDEDSNGICDLSE